MLIRFPQRRVWRRALGASATLGLAAATALVAAAPPAAASAVPAQTTSPAAITAADPLPYLNITGDYVSGISSGAAEAVQLQVAYSATFQGLAFFAGPAYDCAQDSATLAVYACAYDTLPSNVGQLEDTAAQWASQGLIDPTSDLAGKPVYEWHGTLDTVVAGPVADEADSFLRHFGASVDYVDSVPSGHGWISPIAPEVCSASFTPYLDNCGNDPEHAFLARWFGSVDAPNLGSPAGQLISFDQNAYAPSGDAADVSLASTGYEYVPGSCANGAACRLVLALHGCSQDTADVGSAFIEDTYLNQYADSNNFVVLYPQAAATAGANPLGCWDWWGYLGNDSDYAQKSGAQMTALMNMVAANGG